MFKKSYKLTTILVSFLLFCHFSLFSDDLNTLKIDEMDRSWFSVMNGSPDVTPVQTNYGFITIEDSKFLTNYSKNGQCLWQTNMGSKINGFTVSETEFIYVTNQRQFLFLVNPSGLILWNRNLGFTPIENPLCGIDGRVFLRSTDTVSCYGINGILKWSLETETQSRLESKTLNDGSIIIFLEKTHEGKTCALRISPFGAVLEEIVFQGKVINSFTSNNGIILVFSSGEIGMASISASGENKGLIYSKWINKDVKCNEYTSCRQIKDSKYALFTPQVPLVILNSSNGTIEKQFSVPEIKDNAYLFFETIDDKLIFANPAYCAVYNTNGKKIKTLEMPSRAGKYTWNFSIFMNSGYLAFFSKNWTVNAFKIISTSRENESSVFAYHQGKNLQAGYKSFIKIPEYLPSSDTIGNEVYSLLLKENYGIREQTVTDNLNAVLNSWFESKTTEKSTREVFETFKLEYSDVDIENALRLVPLLQTHYFQQKLAQMISVETDKTMQILLLKTVNKCAYDPGGEILSQIETLIRNTNPKDKVLLQNCIEAVYEICRFMGRPALLSKGKDILGRLFYPQYEEATKKSVRQALKKLADLNM